MKQRLPPEIASPIHAAVAEWTRDKKTARLWDRDKTLWTGADEDRWPGWLDIADRQLEQSERFQKIASDVKAKGYPDAVLPGMGGPSLCPEVLSVTFGRQQGFPVLRLQQIGQCARAEHCGSRHGN